MIRNYKILMRGETMQQIGRVRIFQKPYDHDWICSVYLVRDMVMITLAEQAYIQ